MAVTKILVPGRNVWRQTAAPDSSVIVDAADYYRVFYAAAERARRYILLSGWQFDRGVKLLRGPYAVGRGPEVRLVKFLDRLCRRIPSLHVYILAWDFNMVFALEREWMQRLWFHYATHKRMIFRFDDADAAQGSHHQKFAVIDDQHAFLGGIDLCEARWDERDHRTHNPLRRSRGRAVKPYHDLQAHLVGPEATGALREVFLDRWSRSASDPIDLDQPGPDPRPLPPALPSLADLPGVWLGPATVSLSRTDPRGPGETIKEVEHLFADAIAAADHLIYIETQYFSSTRIRDALVERMRVAERARLEIVVVVNPHAEAFKEEVAVGLRQAKNLERLRQVAGETGHALGLYYSLSAGAGKAQRPTYIHSKMMSVDDRFVTVGSANLTNRSMEVDSELHASWEAPAGTGALVRRIRRLRVSLLAEHAGLAGPAAIRPLVPIPGLVARLDAIAQRPDARLRVHAPPTPGQKQVMAVVDPEKLPFDPLRAEYSGSDDDEPIHEPADSR
jgi:phospholipase D1/2